MAKFKPGDRVRKITDGHVPAGTTGTVLEYSAFPFVKWDNWHNGGDMTFGDGRRSVYAVSQERLELITPAETPPTSEQETFRDRIAIEAMGAMMERIGILNVPPQDFAAKAYEIADAMLKARDGK